MWTSIAYASAWIATAIGVVVGIYFTGSAYCLWAFLLPASISLTVSSTVDNKNSEVKDGNAEECSSNQNLMKG